MLAQFYPPIAGGEERHVRALSAALVARGHEVDVLTTATPACGAGTREEQTGDVSVRVHRVPTTTQRIPRLHSDAQRPHSPPFPDPAMAAAVGRLLRQGAHDVVHAHDWVVMSALAPAWRQGTPVLVSLHDYGEVCATKRLVYEGSACPGPSLRRCTKCAAAHYGPSGPLVAALNAGSSAWRRRAVEEFLPVSGAVARASKLAELGVRHTVVPNFVPDALVGAGTPAPPAPDAPTVYAGDVSADKGADVLLEAWRALDGRLATSLVLAGRRVGGAGSSPPGGASLLGELPHAEVMQLMAGARLVVVPSIYPDPCPTVVLEAMAAGRPVVASATGGIGDLVVDGETGILVTPGDAGALREAIERVLSDPEAAAAMGRAGRERARRFTASAVVEQVEAAYERAVRGAGRRKPGR
jgi:glycogen(starch) synthase